LVRASEETGRAGSCGRSAPLIGGAKTVAGTGTDWPSPVSLTVLPAQLPPSCGPLCSGTAERRT
jgi:hypothetical protein